MSERAATREAAARGLVQRLIFWDFPRASWRYDVAVGIILLFIFATPREWFRDQPKASSIVLLSTMHNSQRVFIQTELLEGVPDPGRPAATAAGG